MESHQQLIEQWIDRETQLNQLHDEIVTQREALLRSAETYKCAQAARSSESLDSLNRSSHQRNAHLMQDIENAQKSLEEIQYSTSTQGNRFATLQTNYWSMVRSILPVWEDELLDYKQRLKARRETKRMSRERLG